MDCIVEQLTQQELNKRAPAERYLKVAESTSMLFLQQCKDQFSLQCWYYILCKELTSAIQNIQNTHTPRRILFDLENPAV
jgi:hypothetical protein